MDRGRLGKAVGTAVGTQGFHQSCQGRTTNRQSGRHPEEYRVDPRVRQRRSLTVSLHLLRGNPVGTLRAPISRLPLLYLGSWMCMSTEIPERAERARPIHTRCYDILRKTPRVFPHSLLGICLGFSSLQCSSVQWLPSEVYHIDGF